MAFTISASLFMTGLHDLWRMSLAVLDLWIVPDLGGADAIDVILEACDMYGFLLLWGL